MKLTPECFGTVCMLPPLTQWYSYTRKGTRARKCRLRKWLLVNEIDGARRVVDYASLKSVLTSLRKKPVEHLVRDGSLLLRYPRGQIRFFLRDATPGFERAAEGALVSVDVPSPRTAND